jgi:histidyl-tRNA synthetase
MCGAIRCGVIRCGAMSISTKPPSGTRDFLPLDIARRRHVVGVVETVYQQYGFVPLETPALENLTTLLGKYGDEGDQLLYRLLHRRDALARALEASEVQEKDLADQGLRYDLTVPLARVVAQYRDLPRFFKRYQVQPVWRADRPGRGRFREFYQCDVDIVGTESLIADAEVCGAVCQVLETLGFSDFVLRVNHRQLLWALIEHAGITREQESTALVAVDKLDKIGRDGVLKELSERGIKRATAETLLASLQTPDTDTAASDVSAKNEAELARLSALLDGSESGRKALAELRQLFELSADTPAAKHALLAPELARGLSYYTGPIFEINVADLAGSLGGGGRYDNLIGMFGKQQIPAVGCSLGLERILLVMQQREMYPALASGAQVVLCWMGVPAQSALKTAHALRAQGLRVEVHPGANKLGKQLQYADSPGVKAPVAAIIGQSEVDSGQVTLKHLQSGEQKTVAVSEASQTIAEWD